MICSTLSVCVKNTHSFDPTNREHVDAFLMLYVHGRQHPTLRFYLEKGFECVPDMMLSKIINHMFADRIDNLLTPSKYVKSFISQRLCPTLLTDPDNGLFLGRIKQSQNN